MDILEIARKLFREPLKQPNSIQIDFSGDGENPSPKDILSQLIIIFNEGMKYFYGDQFGKVDLSKLTHQDFYKINEYFNSFGFQIHYDIKELDDPTPPNFPNTILDDFIIFKTQYMKYYIAFSYYVDQKKCSQNSI